MLIPRLSGPVKRIPRATDGVLDTFRSLSKLTGFYQVKTPWDYYSISLSSIKWPHRNSISYSCPQNKRSQISRAHHRAPDEHSWLGPFDTQVIHYQTDMSRWYHLVTTTRMMLDLYHYVCQSVCRLWFIWCLSVIKLLSPYLMDCNQTWQASLLRWCELTALLTCHALLYTTSLTWFLTPETNIATKVALFSSSFHGGQQTDVTLASIKSTNYLPIEGTGNWKGGRFDDKEEPLCFAHRPQTMDMVNLNVLWV